MNLRTLAITAAILLSSCDNPQPSPQQAQQAQQATQGSSMMENMAGAAVAGAAAGSAGAVAHTLTNKAIDHVSKRRRASRIQSSRRR